MYYGTVSAESKGDKEVCIPKCTPAWQPEGQKHTVCLGIWPYALTRTQVKMLKKTERRGLCVMWLHNTQYGRMKKGYGATPSRGRHKESLHGGHMNPSHEASIWGKQ